MFISDSLPHLAPVNNIQHSDQLVHELQGAVARDDGQVLWPAITQPGDQTMSGGWAELIHTRSQSSKGQELHWPA